jgi:hypothetical protein
MDDVRQGPTKEDHKRKDKENKATREGRSSREPEARKDAGEKSNSLNQNRTK